MVALADTVFDAPQGQFELWRYPHRAKSTLRAWEAADEYLLSHLANVEPQTTAGWLIANDSFGALAVALADCQPVTMSDSILSHLATTENLERNGLDASSVTLLGSLDAPPGPIDYLVIKVPKSLALLEDQLHRLRPFLHGATVVVGAGMTRRIHTSTLDLFEAIVGPTTTSRAQKKARLIFATLDPALDIGPSPYPTSFRLDSGHEVVNHAAVFSRRRLDAGTQLLLDNLPTDLGDVSAVDLGCGNGAVGLKLALNGPGAAITFVDSSFMAAASAEATFRAAFGDEREAAFVVGDSLRSLDAESVGLVVNNPPFHEDRSLGDAVAWQMFNDAHRCLRPGGELYVVGNRHLGYHVKLKRIFGNVEVVASNPKFVVLRAMRDL